MARLPAKTKRLTPRQLKVAKLLATGGQLDYECYQQVFPNASKETAQTKVATLKKRAEVQKIIERARQKILMDVDVTVERVVAEIAAVGFAQMPDVVQDCEGGFIVKSMQEIPVKTMPAVKSLQHTRHGIRVELHDKLQALNMLMKRLGAYEDHDDGGPAPGLNIYLDGRPLGATSQ